MVAQLMLMRADVGSDDSRTRRFANRRKYHFLSDDGESKRLGTSNSVNASVMPDFLRQTCSTTFGILLSMGSWDSHRPLVGEQARAVSWIWERGLASGQLTLRRNILKQRY